jgi:hypothetical protein
MSLSTKFIILLILEIIILLTKLSYTENKFIFENQKPRSKRSIFQGEITK